MSLFETIKNSRKLSIERFEFHKGRCRVLTNATEVLKNAILYWMVRDCRVQDNWALLYAQRLALKYHQPLYVVFHPLNSLYPTERHQKFLFEGLELVKNECESLNIKFYMTEDIRVFLMKNRFGGIVTDFSPLKEVRNRLNEVIECLGEIPLVEVDAHNIVPVWVASNKQEIMARTLRPKITKLLNEYLTEFPTIKPHPFVGKKLMVVNLTNCQLPITRHNVAPITEIVAGEQGGLKQLEQFTQNSLKTYGNNDPNLPTSNLSAWLNFGQISAQRVALEINKQPTTNEKFLEELIIRRELSDNFCYYNLNYDNMLGAAEWAQKTLSTHKGDKRQYEYSKHQFEHSKTHDPIWNAAQNQLVVEGKVHGYLRMYWCKKVLEWTKSPEEALEIALWLNNTYALDGNDPNGFVGVMWSICGVHDQGWRERPIFGKIRYMVDYSLKRKFNMNAYIAKHLRL